MSPANPVGRAADRSKTALGVGLVIAVVAIFAPKLPLLDRLELLTQDVRFHLRGARVSHTRVAVIGIDDDTMAAWQDRPMAFWGDRYAALLRNARALGVSEVAVDIIPSTHGEEYLQMITGRALEQARLRTNSAGSLSEAAIDAILKAPGEPEMAPDTAFRNAVIDAHGHVALANNIARQLLLPELADIKEITRRPYIGFPDLPALSDDAARVAPLFVRDSTNTDGDRVIPSLSTLVAARAFDDAASDDSEWRPDRASDLIRMARGRSKAVGPLETFLTNPLSGPSDLPPIISAVRLAGGAGALTPAERDSLRGAVAVIGNTAHHADNDVYRAPGGTHSDVPGVVFQAWAIATLLDGAALARFDGWQEGLIAAGFVVLWTLAARVARLSFVPGTALAFGIAVIWGAAAFYFFVHADLLLPVAVPGVFVVADALLTYGVASAEERAARRHVEGIFGRNVSPAIRDYLIQHDTTALQAGAVTTASVLFFDVRGSTAFAEQRSPEEVIAALNRIYAVIVPIVEEEGGIVNRFLGDGFLALFGVLQPMPDHAHRAAEAAIRIADLLDTPASPPVAPGLSGGCGVHSGPVVSGYLGAKNRAEFTVIGDAVNLAARLESLNKTLGTMAVLSEATVSQLPEPMRLRLTGPRECAIAGRREPATVFTIPRRR